MQIGDVSLIEYLLQNGAKWDKTDPYGRTPLHYCILHEHPQAAKQLLKRYIVIMTHCEAVALSMSNPLSLCFTACSSVSERLRHIPHYAHSTNSLVSVYPRLHLLNCRLHKPVRYINGMILVVHCKLAACSR